MSLYLSQLYVRNYNSNHVWHSKFLLNLAAFCIIMSLFLFIAIGFKEITEPRSVLENVTIDLSPINLLEYTFRTVLRILIAILFSLIFSLIYASIAAKNVYAEQILIPLLDVLQSVPILGYISFTVTGFLTLFPNSVIGPELVAIFAIFTSQAWNMTFSFYQSLKTVPQDLYDAGAIFKMSKWQQFWRIELPYGLPGLIWNITISMSSSWFFIVAAEVITVGSNKIILPGIGSYIAIALDQENVRAIIYSLITMSVAIFIYDQLLLRTLVAWVDKFKYEMISGSGQRPKSWMLDIIRKSSLIQSVFSPLSYISQKIIYTPIFAPKTNHYDRTPPAKHLWLKGEYLWYLFLVSVIFVFGYELYNFLRYEIGTAEILKVTELVMFTFIRIISMLILATIIWVPVGIYIGLHPGLSIFFQPIAQFLAAFPANLLFPVVVITIVHYSLIPNIWLTPLIIFGSQWYILFNVISGSISFPVDLREVATNLQLKGWLWCRKVMLPAIAPHYVTGVITAYGGAWNASIIAEVVNYGDKRIVADGIGSYIAVATTNADFPRVVLGIGAMSLCIVVINKLFWQPVHNYVSNKYKL